MKMLNNELQQQLREVFSQLQNKVTIALFTDQNDCSTCKETKEFMEELLPLSDKLELKNYDIDNDSKLAQEYDVKMVPSIVLLDQEGNYKRIKFNGIPAGHEINSFIPALIEVSGAQSALPEEMTKAIMAINKPVDIKVFITLGCPHCPGAVQKAHKLALMNENIHAEMIEAQTFNELSNKYNVSGVPKIVINDTHELVGNQPIEAFLEKIENIA
ncbi:thioredoxin family protein [Vallitaleaceae bacterium 9-2]